MALTGNQRAPLTARLGVARLGAVRLGFTPRDTQGLTPGSSGGFYVWKRVYPAAYTWTTVKRP